MISAVGPSFDDGIFSFYTQWIIARHDNLLYGVHRLMMPLDCGRVDGDGDAWTVRELYGVFAVPRWTDETRGIASWGSSCS